ncbi:hypothetical protein [Halomonas sp.]|uniref:hypothetical protein n=1 Tax=Halomonas sp. TaxID=1486246 RepID=UPI00384F3C2B
MYAVIDEGGVSVERDGANVLIRIDEQGTFPSGSADVTEDFIELLQNLSQALSEMPDGVAIDGHTNDVPIHA